MSVGIVDANMPECVQKARDFRPTIAKFVLTAGDPIGIVRVESARQSIESCFCEIKNIGGPNEREFQYLDVYVIIKK